MRSGIYIGSVMHERLLPRHHRFRYPYYLFLLDLDELEQLDHSLRLFSCNRLNLFGFAEADYARGQPSLRHEIARNLACRGIETGNGRIGVLTLPRLCGYAFNPLSLYYCWYEDGRLAAVIYDVTNIKRERVWYVLPHGGDSAGGRPIFQTCEKTLRVSPFTADAGHYSFHGDVPGERAVIGVLYREAGRPVLKTRFSGARRPLDDATLAALAVRLPLQSIKIIASIYYEALRLWVKGVPRPGRSGH